MEPPLNLKIEINLVAGGEPPAANQVMWRTVIAEETAQQCARAFGEGLQAVVLTGSLARDEATFQREGAFVRLHGDADYFLIFRSAAALPSSSSIDSLEKLVETRLAEHGVLAKVGLSPVKPHYLRHLPAEIATYELRSCGRIVWGDVSVLSLVPEFPASAISREDAWRMLCNRMIEQLEYVPDLSEHTTKLSPALHYATVKLYLDLATSYLVFAGAYEPTYRSREKRLRELAGTEDATNGHAPFPLKAISKLVTECTYWKLTGEESASDRRLEFWEDAIRYACLLWQWETIQMTADEGELSISALWKRVAAKQTVTQRLRAWVSLLRRTGWYRSWRNWPRWFRLSFQATPRYLIYRVGAELAFSLTDLVRHEGVPPGPDVDWNQLGCLIPVREAAAPVGGDAWKHLTQDTVSNYWRFLAHTRA